MLNITTANQIVEQLSLILKTDINFISSEGIIISSTTKTRVNDYHSVGHQAAVKNEITTHHGASIDNVFAGVNIPIEFDYKVVGVIGLTGNPNQFATIARVCKAMTETLIKEIYYANRINYYTNEMKRIIEYIIFDNSTEAITKVNEYFNNDMDNLYFVLVHAKEEILSTLFQQLVRDDKYCLSQIGDILVILTNDLNFNDTHLKNFGNNIKVGVGNTKQQPKYLLASYNEAMSCMKVCQKYEVNYCHYNDLKTEHLLNSIPLEKKLTLVEHFFKSVPEVELDAFVKLYIYYYESNRSLTQTAEHLFIHKNTVKYRLEKLKKYTDLDYLNIVESALIYYLCRLYYDIDY